MPSKTIAYLRVSTGGQDLELQKLAILEHACRHRTPVADFVAVHSAAGSRAQREQQFPLRLQAQYSLGELHWPFVNIDAKIPPDWNDWTFLDGVSHGYCGSQSTQASLC